MRKVLDRAHGGRLMLALAGLGVMGAIGPAAQARGPQGASLRPGVEEPAVVQGSVAIGIPIPLRRPTTAYPTRAVPAPVLAPESERRNVIVYLRNARPQSVAPMHVAIRQRNETFTPRVVAVTIGSEVEFPNDDPIYHNVFSLSRAKNFNLGRYPRGDTRRVRFDKVGVVKVFCEIHSHMSAAVMVFDHPWFAMPDDAGRFVLKAVPPGDRQITAWHERLGDTTINLRVEPGRATTADFVLPVPNK